MAMECHSRICRQECRDRPHSLAMVHQARPHSLVMVHQVRLHSRAMECRGNFAGFLFLVLLFVLCISAKIKLSQLREK